jgi:cytochrome bd-type quinol oxidase subunit 1
MGSNTSLRRSLCERAGGWDEGLSHGEESSLYFRYQRVKQPGEQLIYDPEPVVWRRTNVEGGLDRRTRPRWYLQELDSRARFYLRSVAYYFPWRFWPIFFLYPFRILLMTWGWILDPDNNFRSLPERLWALVAVAFALPMTLLKQGLDWMRPEVKRMPKLIRQVGSIR